MTPLPAVSVVVPLYNKAGNVLDTINSALNQSFADFEIIVVDDGSTDGSVDILKICGDPRLVLVQQQNAGVAAARNRAVAEARAPLIAFLDADDLWAPDHLRHLVELTRRFPQAALFGNRFRAFGSDIPPQAASGQVEYSLLDDYFAACAAGRQPLFTSSCMARRDDILALGGFPHGHSRGEDLALWIKLAAGAPVAVSSYLGCWYRRGLGGLTARPVTEPDISMRTLDGLLAANPAWPPARRRDVREYYNRIALAHALDSARAGERSAALMFIALAAGTTARRQWWQARLMAAAPRPLRDLAFYVKERLRSSP